jgi:glycosyltransferase involved in cell wall biosynthesis
VQSKLLVILHDYFESAEGGGRLCMLLADSMRADIAYGFRIRDHPYFEIYHPGNCYDLHAYSDWQLWRQLKLLRSFKSSTQFVEGYSNAMYSGSYSPLAVLYHAANNNILYCHTPPRFIYDKRDYYLARLPFWQRPLLQYFINYLQPRYEKAVARMNVIVANSYTVKKRIHRYLGRKAQVIYPPCDTTRFSWNGQQKYYLSTARLDVLKQVDLCIEAFLKMPDRRLLVASGGLELSRLKKIAQDAPNIHFTGWVSESRLRDLIGNAIATIYLPRDEDFGMSPVESMAAGKPVIGVAAGGLLETVVHEETGLLLPANFNLENLISAVQRMTSARALKMRPDCERRAQLFSRKRFLDKMVTLIENT